VLQVRLGCHSEGRAVTSTGQLRPPNTPPFLGPPIPRWFRMMNSVAVSTNPYPKHHHSLMEIFTLKTLHLCCVTPLSHGTGIHH
jgi:hypothetical protein